MAQPAAKIPIGQRITAAAFDLLRQHPDGVRYAELVRRVSQEGSFKINTIHGNVWDLEQRFPEKVYKPSRGLFRLLEFRDQDTDQLRSDLVPEPPTLVREQDFYEAFADYLQNDLEECTKAIPLGGNRFRDKWGTPDVIGKRESKRSDILTSTDGDRLRRNQDRRLATRDRIRSGMCLPPVQP